jgi:hypothetical protein
MGRRKSAGWRPSDPGKRIETASAIAAEGQISRDTYYRLKRQGELSFIERKPTDLVGMGGREVDWTIAGSIHAVTSESAARERAAAKANGELGGRPTHAELERRRVLEEIADEPTLP